MAVNNPTTALRGLRFSSSGLSDEVQYRLRVLSALNPSDELYAQTIEDILNSAAPLSAGSETVKQWISHLSKEDVLATKANQVELSLRLALAQRFKLLADECMNGILWHVFNLTKDDVAQQAPGLNPLAMPYYEQEESSGGRAVTYSTFTPAQSNNAVMLAQALIPSGKNGLYFPTTPTQKVVSKVNGVSGKSFHSEKIAQNRTVDASASKPHSQVGGPILKQDFNKPHTIEKPPSSPVKAPLADGKSLPAQSGLELSNNFNTSDEVQKSGEPAEIGGIWNKEGPNTEQLDKHSGESNDKKSTSTVPSLSAGMYGEHLVHENATESTKQGTMDDQVSSADQAASSTTKVPGVISSLDLGSSKFLKTIESNRVSKFMHSRYKPINQGEGVGTVSEGLHIWATNLDIETDDIQIFSISETLPWPERLVVSALLRTFGSGTFELFRKVSKGEKKTGSYFVVFGQLPDNFLPELCIVGAVDRAGDDGMGFFAKFEPVAEGACQLCKRRHDGRLCRNVEHVNMYGFLRLHKYERSLLD